MVWGIDVMKVWRKVFGVEILLGGGSVLLLGCLSVIADRRERDIDFAGGLY